MLFGNYHAIGLKCRLALNFAIEKLFEEIPFAGNQSPKTRLLYVKNISN